MQCPKCGKSLVATQIHGIEVDQCEGCQGIWFDEAELSQLLSLEPAELKPLLKGKRDEGLNEKLGKCPRDGRPLLQVLSARDSAITLDLCVTCRGIWLDRGEFEALRRAAQD